MGCGASTHLDVLRVPVSDAVVVTDKQQGQSSGAHAASTPTPQTRSQNFASDSSHEPSPHPKAHKAKQPAKIDQDPNKDSQQPKPKSKHHDQPAAEESTKSTAQPATIAAHKTVSAEAPSEQQPLLRHETQNDTRSTTSSNPSPTPSLSVSVSSPPRSTSTSPLPSRPARLAPLKTKGKLKLKPLTSKKKEREDEQKEAKEPVERNKEPTPFVARTFSRPDLSPDPKSKPLPRSLQPGKSRLKLKAKEMADALASDDSKSHANVLAHFSAAQLRAMTRPDLERIFAHYDRNGNGSINRKEMEQLAKDCVARTLKLIEDDVRAYNPNISAKELQSQVDKERKFVMPGKDIKEAEREMKLTIVKKLDVNGDGNVSKTEFIIQWGAMSNQIWQAKDMSGAAGCTIM